MLSRQAVEKLQIKIIPSTTPENDSDRAFFALFDFLLMDKSESTAREKIETIKITKPV